MMKIYAISNRTDVDAILFFSTRELAETVMKEVFSETIEDLFIVEIFVREPGDDA